MAQNGCARDTVNGVWRPDTATVECGSLSRRMHGIGL
jgi:hypothetical protein